MLKSFRTFLTEKQEGMLDISIPSFFKWLKIDLAKLSPGTKAYQNANDKIGSVLSGSFKIEEKVDGVKLSLIRNDTEFDPTDYTKNWIVSYKTFILYPFEHEDIDLEKVKVPSNYGNSQYKLIHNRLAKVHAKLGSIPKNTEFFLEFLMRKPTLTRSYDEKNIHNVIFLASSPTESITIKNGRVFTQANQFDQTKEFTQTFIEATGFLPPKVIFSGPLFKKTGTSIELNESGFQYNGLKTKYLELKPEFTEALNSSDWVSVAKLLQTLFTTFSSSYGGGVPEGVVCWSSGSSNPFKFTSSDQYNKDLRKSLKTNLVGDDKALEEYYGSIEEEAEKLFNKIDKNIPFERQIEIAAKLVYNRDLSKIIHPKEASSKDSLLLNKQDDLFLKLKLYLMDIEDATSSSVVNRALGQTEGIGLIVGKFRLPTIAHIELIKKALENTPKVLLALVDTSKKGLSFTERKEILEKSFPGKIIITKVESANLSRILKSFKGKIGSVFCGTDALPSYQNQIDQFNKTYNTQITVHELERTEDDEVSATQLEKAVKVQDQETFDKLASPLLKPYWNQLLDVIR